MTTIAYSAGVLAADSLATDDSTAMQVRKCVRLPKGEAAGGAGDLGEVTQALAWLALGGKGDAPDIPNSAILFTDSGKCYLASGKWPGAECKGSVAIGSGAQGAMLAMLRYGASAEDAVRAVCGIDPYSGGEVEVLAITKGRKSAVKSPRKAK